MVMPSDDRVLTMMFMGFRAALCELAEENMANSWLSRDGEPALALDEAPAVLAAAVWAAPSKPWW